MATIGSSKKTVTLASPNDTLTGTINAYGPAGTYGHFGITFDAAVFGPATKHFTIDNLGLVESAGTATSPNDVGLLLGAAGTITNHGTIAGGNAIAIFGTTGKSVIDNAGTIIATSTIDDTSNESDGFLNFGVGIYTTTEASIKNSGTIAATHIGIVVENALGTVTNSGLITAKYGYGAYLRGGGNLINTGTIDGYTQGVFLYNSAATATSGVTNSGLINAPAKPITINGYFGTFIGLSSGIFQLGAGTVQNLAQGTIAAANGDGVILDALFQNFATDTREVLDGTIINAGTIDAVYGASLYGIGGITNSGKILAVDFGAESQYSLAAVINTGFIEVFGSTFTYTSLVQSGSSFSYGTLTQTAAGIVTTKGGTVTNTGTVIATEGNGISLRDGGYALNEGLITAYRNGIVAGYSAAATVTNFGDITATGTTFTNEQGTLAISHGVLLKDGGIVTNEAAGTIIGETGIAILGTTASDIYNAGHVTATGHAGIYLYPTGAVTNGATGTIKAAHSGIEMDGGGVVYNYGIVNSGRAGIYLIGGGAAYNSGDITAGAAGIYVLSGAGYVYNYAGGKIFASNGINLKTAGAVDNAGYISASATGIVIQGGGTVTESGTIIGGTLGAISFNDAFSASNLLILSPTATIIGTVSGGGGALELEADGKTIGTAAPAQFIDFHSVTIDSHAIWDMAGTFTTSLGLTLLNDGTIHESATDLITISGALTGTGTVDLSKKRFALDGSVASGEKIAFTGTAETLALGDAAAFKGKIESFKSADTIDLSNIPRAAITGAHFAAGILTLTESGSSIKLTFASPASFKNETFALFTDGPGTGITLAQAAAAIEIHSAHATPSSTPQSGWLAHNLTTPTPTNVLAVTLGA